MIEAVRVLGGEGGTEKTMEAFAEPITGKVKKKE